MKKLTLNLDDLSVNSFEIEAPEAPRGTVQGMAEATDNCSQYCGATIFEYIWERTWLQ